MTAAAIGRPRRASLRRLAGLAGALALLAAGCAHAPTGLPPGETALPPIPEVRGELSLYVAYPDSLDPVFAADSNFVFGTTGTGAAELTVNGRPVPVKPNGAFLAWLPVPEPVAGDTARYRLVARADGRADTLVHRFRVPALARRSRSGTWVDTVTAGQAERWAAPAEEVTLSLTAAPELEVGLTVLRSAWWAASPEDSAGPAGEESGRPARREDETSADSVILELPVRETSPGRYVASAPARRLLGGPTPAREVGEGAAGPSGAVGELSADMLTLRWRLTDGRDTARVRGRLPIRMLDPERPPVAVLREEPHPVHGRAGTVAGRPSARGSYAWLFPPGSRVPVDGRIGDRLRLRLEDGLRAWVAAKDAELARGERLPAGSAVPTSRVGTVGAEAREDRVRIRVPVGRRLPAHAAAVGPKTLEVVVHGGLGATERMRYPPGDDLVAALRWSQLAGPRWRLRVELTEPVWGWQLRWAGVAPADSGRGTGQGRAASRGAGSGVLWLDVRRPPRLDPDDPLEGVRVAVDPGHPPVGAEGPTGLTEAAANLGVARRLVDRLREEGAEPVLVRTDSAPVGLYERRRRAREAGADVLISLHNNALPDGVRPFGRAGTSTYYFHPPARGLAREVQRGMLGRMGLRNLGVRWGNLALPRESWMPTVLTEGAFMMIPRHEAALRTRPFREAYASGVVDGLRRWLRARARGGS